MKLNQDNVILDLKNTVVAFCKQWIKYEQALTLRGNLYINYDDTESLVQFNEAFVSEPASNICFPVYPLMIVENALNSSQDIFEGGSVDMSFNYAGCYNITPSVMSGEGNMVRHKFLNICIVFCSSIMCYDLMYIIYI